MAFEYAAFVTRNPLYTLKNWRGQSKVRKAMLAHRKENPTCASCGRKENLHVHHIFPVSVMPLLAHFRSNMITLCQKCHLYVGHNGYYRGRYVEDIEKRCATQRVIKIND